MQKLLRSIPSVNRSPIRHTVVCNAPFGFEKTNYQYEVPIKVFGLDSDNLKNLSDTEGSTFNSGVPSPTGKLSATLRFTIRYRLNTTRVSHSRGPTVMAAVLHGSLPNRISVSFKI